MRVYFAEEAQLHEFLRKAGPGKTYAAVRREAGSEYAVLQTEGEEEPSLRDARPSVSPKRFLLPPRERVARYATSAEPGTGDAPSDKSDTGEQAEPTTVVGLRACDIAAAEYLDKVFLEGDFEDPFYKARRENQIVISVDCTQVNENCFCDVVGGRPFAMGGFDLNISPIAGGYVVWVGTEGGQGLIDAHAKLFREAAQDEIDEVKRSREKTSDELRRQSKGLKLTEHLQEVLSKLEESDLWDKHAAQCVECAACTNICPTCHCFYLYDRAAREGRAGEFERIKTWDSCLTADYSRMAGVGGNKPNPRARLRTRFANRFLHKYGFSPIQYGVLGCTGCGRCMEACFGAVDIRKVLADIEKADKKAAAQEAGRGKENPT